MQYKEDACMPLTLPRQICPIMLLLKSKRCPIANKATPLFEEPGSKIVTHLSPVDSLSTQERSPRNTTQMRRSHMAAVLFAQLR